MSSRTPPDIFADALELEPSERQAFIERACAGDLQLFAEVNELLSLHEEATAIFKTPAPDSQHPEEVGRYRILGELGRGGMGVVYLAKDPKLDRRIALKLLPEELQRRPDRLSRFEREAKLLAALNHPNIAAIHSMEEWEEIPFLTMELVEGPSLSERLKEGSLPIDDSLNICLQIAKALEAAHKQGIVHRDLKPANIMVTSEGLVKVLDFSLGKALFADPRQDSGDTAEGVILGTPGYISPERLGGEEVGLGEDVWSLGCILFECLTGRRAFAGKTPHEANAATLHKDPDWTALPEQTSSRLRDLIERCLVKHPGKRLSTVTEVRRELEECREASPLQNALPAKESAKAPNNLPLSISSFVGRDREMRELARILDGNRLLTLTGAGGCGKTRLALEVGRRLLEDFDDGVWSVSLVPLKTELQIAQALLSAFQLQETPKKPLDQRLAEHLSRMDLLLILDNCEHLLTETSDLAQSLLRTCPELKILITSRKRLGVAGERVYPVLPLEVPGPGTSEVEELYRNDAVRLFVDRARDVHPDFKLSEDNALSVVRICERLDGIPLALELAAARVKVLPVSQICERLDDRFHLLTSGDKTSVPHHQTLRALVDWSYDQLGPKERTLLRRLSVFPGSWDLEAMEAVAAEDGLESWELLDLLSHLIDSSLVEPDLGRGAACARSSYRMLETVRAYARDRLKDEEEAPRVRRRHRDYFVSLAEQAEPHLTGRDQADWLSLLDAQRDNLRLAFRSVESEPEVGLALAAALGRWWLVRGHWTEGREVCATLLDRMPTPTIERARVLAVAGHLARMQTDFVSSRALLNESLALARDLGAETVIGEAENGLGVLSFYQGQHAEARGSFERSLQVFQALNDRQGVARCLTNLGLAHFAEGELQRAREKSEEALAIGRELENPSFVAETLTNLGAIAWHLGNYDQSSLHHEEALVIHREIGNTMGLAGSLNNLASLAQKQGNWASAWERFQESLTLQRELGATQGQVFPLMGLGLLAQEKGDFDQARAFQTERLKIARKHGTRLDVLESLCAFASLAALNQPLRAARLLGAAAAIRETLSEPVDPEMEASMARDLARVREKLGEGPFRSAIEAGRSLSLEEAIEYALGRGEKP